MTTCKYRETCCKAAEGGYGCCPFSRASCCADGKYCCPSGFHCYEGLCLRGALRVPAAKHRLSGIQKTQISGKEQVRCGSSHFTCSDTQTCCLIDFYIYGCCP